MSPRGLYAVEPGSMTGNFMRTDREQPRYTQNIIDGFQSDQPAMVELGALVSAMAPAFNFSSGKDTTYVEAALGPARREQTVRAEA